MIKYIGLTQMVIAISAKIGSNTLAVAVLDATCVNTAVNAQMVRFIAHGGRIDKIIIRDAIHLKRFLNIVFCIKLIAFKRSVTTSTLFFRRTLKGPI